ncbi:prephenate dehydrogenase/arogenate dehydrogenase family protein [Thermoplasmatales archaeon AK]|nr:prephenate dehydrogenase/arogenate dehydrogenase family protein [Thermoplasmatales archaeon AK]
MKIGIIGSSGRLGASLASLLSASNDVLKCPFAECDQRVIENSEFSILCVPTDQAVEIISESNHPERCIEVTAVKSAMRNMQRGFISIHPLFGPKTIGNSRFKNIIFIQDLSIAGSEKVIKEIFPGFNILPMSADDHDRLMLSQLVLPYIVSIMLQDFPEPLTYSSSVLYNAKDIIAGESRQVVKDIFTKNPHIDEFIERIREILKNPSW